MELRLGGELAALVSSSELSRRKYLVVVGVGEPLLLSEVC